MNIKGLLLGSAAALVAVSGARAADAVVIAEPEPVEYVRVCDTYGVGFYYIPGTETCLKVSGYMRYDIGVGYLGNQDVWDKEDFDDVGTAADTNDTYDKRARFALRVDARSETELGTLRAYAELRFNYDTSVTGGVEDEYGIRFGGLTDTNYNWDLNEGYIELGGFRVGKTDSLFTTFTGYAGAVINDTFAGTGYGPFGTHQIAYTFTGGNGFTAAVALEEGYGVDYTLDDYVPHVVGGVGYTGGWGGVSLVAGYDAVHENGAIKGRIDFNATDALSLFFMAGYNTDWDDDVLLIDAVGQNYFAQWYGDWAVWGGGSWKFNEKASLNVQISYSEEEFFAAVANVEYELVPNFRITPEIVYVDNFGDYEDLYDDNWGGFLRFQANFGG
jgi:hypothetical protein